MDTFGKIIITCLLILSLVGSIASMAISFTFDARINKAEELKKDVEEMRYFIENSHSDTIVVNNQIILKYND